MHTVLQSTMLPTLTHTHTKGTSMDIIITMPLDIPNYVRCIDILQTRDNKLGKKNAFADKKFQMKTNQQISQPHFPRSTFSHLSFAV